MRHRQALAALAFLAAALPLAGCITSTPSLDFARLDLERQLPGARFDSELQLNLGRIPLSLARRVVSWADEDSREDAALLWDIRRIQVAIYRTESLPSVRQASFVIPRDRKLKKKGWLTLTRALSPDSATWVLYREDRGRIRDLMVGALDDDELVLVQLTGDIQGIFERLVDEAVLDVPGVVRADLEPEPGEPIATVESQ